MYRNYKLPFEYGWLGAGANGVPSGGGGLQWWGPPLDFFFSFLGWVVLFLGVSMAAFSTACH